MKYTDKFTLEVKMKDFYKMAIPRTEDKKELHRAIRHEMMQCWHGIIDGNFGGNAISWEKVFYFCLFEGGWIYQTELGKEVFGDFKMLMK